ncbi:patatin-like phospholipase family protein [Uliginosibacterium sediminicola]|uniref:Patatin-like phospholipase family protein n=1 Tax=Uliginosibacterium sediminicola TaxID=2024550 RepID=A0ABU9Z3J4_9RHOO
MARRALVISGGAPNATLVGGALEAFAELGLEFDVVSMSGAGALLGLMYLAPRNGEPIATLRGLTELGIADAIYERFPVNYKVFNKPGELADVYRQMLAGNPLLQRVMAQPAQDPLSQLAKDGLSLWLASWCPSSLTPSSTGLCAHVPFAEEIIDFAQIAHVSPALYLNAYNLSQRRMENFDKHALNTQHLQAALSFPFLYPPTQIGEDLYIEGAALDCLNFKGLMENHPELEEIVVFDLLGAERLLRAPRDLYDAWVMSILTPLVEIARDDVKLFEQVHMPNYPQLKPLFKVPLVESVPEQFLPDVFDWSRSNLERLYTMGYATARRYAEEHL